MKVALAIMIIWHKLINCEYNLIWEDDFIGDKLDDKFWRIKAEKDWCEKQFDQRSESCNTFSNKNIQIVNGTLKLTVVKEDYHGANYTGATIKSLLCFKNARIEVRARKPIGKYLDGGILMYAYENECGLGEWRGQVDLVKLRNNSKLWNSVHYAQWRSLADDRSAPEDLNQYHVYGVEWNDTVIQWFIDTRIVRTQRLQDKNLQDALKAVNESQHFYLPYSHSFNVVLHVGVNSFIPWNTTVTKLTDQEYAEWVSPSFDIDYIRVYDKSTKGSPIPLVDIIVVSLVGVVVTLLVLLIVSVYLYKKQKQRNLQVKIDGLYDDSFDGQLDEHDGEYVYENYDEQGYQEIELSLQTPKREYIAIEN